MITIINNRHPLSPSLLPINLKGRLEGALLFYKILPNLTSRNFKMKKVILGFSGGIDSFYTAYILKESGYNVLPVFLKLLPNSHVEKAKKSAELLNLPLKVVDLQKEFRKEVIDYFISYYKKGLTPNPCAVCNQKIKLKYLYRLLEETNSNFVSTGHYAKVTYVRKFKRHLIKRGKDRRKEQSYFLALVEQKIFEKLLLPLGDCTKEEVIEKAKELGFPFEGESQDVCFIDSNYVDFLKPYIKEREGKFVLEDGTVVGKHTGFFKFTVGQRRGLGISYRHPLYVLGLRPEENTVVVGPKDRVLKNEIFIWKVNWHIDFQRIREVPLSVQIRYRSKPTRVSSIEYFKNGIYRVKLAAKVEAPAPGQVCAFYTDDLLLGGGEITKEGVG